MSSLVNQSIDNVTVLSNGSPKAFEGNHWTTMAYLVNQSIDNVTALGNGSDTLAKSALGPNPYDLLTTSLFTIIFVTGVMGSSFVISTVLRWDEMKTSCNFLIMTIAMADLGVAVLAAPIRIIDHYIGWPFGEAMCRLLVPWQDVFICVSVVAHTCIALERYRAIVTPFKRRISLRKVKFVIVGLWIGCYLAAGLPIALLLYLAEKKGKTACMVFPPSVHFKKVYKMFLIVVFIVIPLVIQTYAYCWIVRCIKKKTLISESRSGPQQQRNRLIKMLLTSVLVFDICYLPRGILMVLYEYGNRQAFPPQMKYINLIALVMYYVKHVINPVILFAMSADFRAGFYAICKRGQFELSQERSSKRNSSKKKMIMLNNRKKSADEQQNQPPQTVAALLENSPKLGENLLLDKV